MGVRYRKSLELELKKLRGEINDICKVFDDKLESLARLFMLVAREVLLQELVVSRLGEWKEAASMPPHRECVFLRPIAAHSIVERDYLVRTVARMDDQIGALRAEYGTTAHTLDRLQEEMDNARARLSTLMVRGCLLAAVLRSLR